MANLTIRGAFAGVAGADATRAGHGVVDDSATRSSAAFVVATTPETEINDPVRILAPGVTLDGFTFDVTAIFGFSADVELTGGNTAVEFAGGTAIVNSRFIETIGGDAGASNQTELAISVPYVDGLMIANNAFYGEASIVQIGSAVFDGQIDVVANTIVDGSIYVTVRPGSAATVSIIGNVLSGERPFGDFPFGINGSGFWADPLPSSVLEGLNNVGEGNDIIAGGPGNDELGGGGGSDTLDGGPATTSSWATEPSPRRVPVSPGMTP